MGKIVNLKQAIDKATNLLATSEYTNANDVTIIAKKLIAQVYIVELYRMKQDRFAIAEAVGVKEKAVRMWYRADHCPNIGHLIKLEKFYRKTLKVNMIKSE